jgi:hypothetical protein
VAKPGDCLIDHRLHVGLFRDISADETDAKALFQRRSFFLPTRGDDYFGAFLGILRPDSLYWELLRELCPSRQILSLQIV